MIVTAHTAGWEIVGPLLARDYGIKMMIAMALEADARAMHVYDGSRKATGLEITHIGDPLASLPLLRHLKSGGVVALQLDRVVPGMRTRRVTMLGTEGTIPEGPLRLAELSGAPILPVFSARIGYHHYLVESSEVCSVPRRASGAVLDEAAQRLATDMTRLLRAHPTQWFSWQ